MKNKSSTKVKTMKNYESSNTLKKWKWKIHLTMKTNFLSSKYSGEKCQMHSKTNIIEIMIGNDICYITGELCVHF